MVLLPRGAVSQRRGNRSRSPSRPALVPTVAEPIKSPRQHALDAASDQALDFVHYDRNEDDELPEATKRCSTRSCGAARSASRKIVASFERTLRECLGVAAGVNGAGKRS